MCFKHCDSYSRNGLKPLVFFHNFTQIILLVLGAKVKFKGHTKRSGTKNTHIRTYISSIRKPVAVACSLPKDVTQFSWHFIKKLRRKKTQLGKKLPLKLRKALTSKDVRVNGTEWKALHASVHEGNQLNARLSAIYPNNIYLHFPHVPLFLHSKLVAQGIRGLFM